MTMMDQCPEKPYW